MGYQWVATELLTGVQICDLNDLVLQQDLADTIGRYEVATVSLPLPTAPPAWQRAVMEGATSYWLLEDNPAGGAPLILWGGYITQTVLDQTDAATITLSTYPGYFDQRFTGTRSYTNEDQNLIVEDLIMNCVAAGPNGGIPITVQIVGGAGQTRTQAYADQDDKTVYSALQDMMNWQRGPEWWVGGVWDGQLIKPVLYVGSQLGTASTIPNAVFDLPGNLQAAQLTRAFSQGKGANSVMAYSSGQGTSRPQSTVQNFADPDRPTFEYRWTPSTSILDVDTLNGYAQQALTNMQTGSKSLTASATADQPGTPAYMVDWVLGDDVGYLVGGPLQTSDKFTGNLTDQFGVPNYYGNVPAFPDGLTGVARAIGMRITLDNTRTITPVLAGGGLEAA